MSSDIRGVELKIQFPHGSTRNFNFSFFNLYRNFTERTGGIPSDLDKGLSAAALSLYARLSRRVLYISCFYQPFLFDCERGFTIFLQSRSPLSIAMISISAIAMFVATGTL